MNSCCLRPTVSQGKAPVSSPNLGFTPSPGQQGLSPPARNTRAAGDPGVQQPLHPFKVGVGAAQPWQGRPPDEHGRVEQGGDGRHVDTHQHLAVDVGQPHVAVLHLAVGLIIVQDQLHLQEAWGGGGQAADMEGAAWLWGQPSRGGNAKPGRELQAPKGSLTPTPRTAGRPRLVERAATSGNDGNLKLDAPPLRRSAGLSDPSAPMLCRPATHTESSIEGIISLWAGLNRLHSQAAIHIRLWHVPVYLGLCFPKV